MRSIAFRLWLGFMSLVVLLIALLWTFQIVFLDSFYSRSHITQLHQQSDQLLHILQTNSTNTFKEEALGVITRTNGSIEQIDERGNSLLYLGTGNTSSMPLDNNLDRRKAYSDVLSGKSVAIRIDNTRFNNEYYLIGYPIMEADKQSGALVFIYPLAAIEETTYVLKQQLIYISVFLLVASIVAAILLARSFTRPIKAIMNASRQIASGNFSTAIALSRKDELGKLSASIQTMSVELSRIDRLRKELVANVSHELRTPLSVIRGYAETLRDVTGGDAHKREKQLAIIIEETDRLSIIVEDILNLSQMQSGTTKLAKHEFPLNETIEKVIESYALLCAQNNIQIHLNCPDEIWTFADEMRIMQVLHNILNNAIKHTSHMGRIDLTVTTSTVVRLEIKDTGIGMNQDELLHIWDRFYKVDKQGRMPGSGLGLALVKEILLAHEFPFGMESEDGIGTTFWMEMPLLPNN